MAIHAAFDAGINFFFSYGFDIQMTRAMRELTPARRWNIVLATGAYNYIWWQQDVRKALEKRLRQFRTDYIDVFLFLGVMKPGEFPHETQEALLKLKEEGKVGAFGISCHDRRFLGKLASEGALDVLMLRRPKSWPKKGRVPTAGECYRFVLSNRSVHISLTAPRNERQLRENIEAVTRGPLGPDDMAFMREFGDTVHKQGKWFK